jgi:hypothetical protein
MQLFHIAVSICAIRQHIKTIFDDGELAPDSVIKEYLTTAENFAVVQGGKQYE